MKMRYFLDGVSTLSDDVEVVAQSSSFYYILKTDYLLYAINKKHVPVRAYDNADDEPPYVTDYIKARNANDDLDEPTLDLDFHLPTMDQAH